MQFKLDLRICRNGASARFDFAGGRSETAAVKGSSSCISRRGPSDNLESKSPAGLGSWELQGLGQAEWRRSLCLVSGIPKEEETRACGGVASVRRHRVWKECLLLLRGDALGRDGPVRVLQHLPVVARPLQRGRHLVPGPWRHELGTHVELLQLQAHGCQGPDLLRPVVRREGVKPICQSIPMPRQHGSMDHQPSQREQRRALHDKLMDDALTPNLPALPNAEPTH
mmetsp:Transcript_47977/g.138899  ORF Transcript_47977/g.138899 Transcript_47977/m.138899 type:complete len:226 (+) Transcript_47977:173-850(+)